MGEWFRCLCGVAVLLGLGSGGWAQPVLPPPDLQLEESNASLRVLVVDFQFVGNTVYTDKELRAVVADMVGKALGNQQLEEARQRLTALYVSDGYVNSGLLLNDQDLVGGVVVFTVEEGELDRVNFTGIGRLRVGPITSMLRRRAGQPLNLNELREGLLTLKGDPNVKRVNAELRPGEERGKSVLDIEIEERSPWRLDLAVRNDRPPSVGSTTIETRAAHSNVTGYGDHFEWRHGWFHGGVEEMEFSELDDWGVSYEVPIRHQGLSVRAFYDEVDFDVLEEPFTTLGANSRSSTAGFGFRYSLVERLERQVLLGLTAERRRSQTELLGEPFSLSPGAVDGETTMTVLRFSQEWIERSQRRVMALRSTFSLGVDLLGASDDGSDRDGTFLAWLGQGQYVLRLGETQNQLLLTGSLQWASDPLLSLEQFSIGGGYTVRGYRENELVRDMGAMASLELHVPVWFSGTGRPILSLVPFFDVGAGWNTDSELQPGEEIASLGAGLVFEPHDRVSGRFFWGYPLNDIETDQDDLQDLGIHFRLNVSIF